MGRAQTSTLPAWRRVTLAFGAMVVVFGTVAILLDTGTEGHVHATERTTLEIRTRATAVLEPGGELRWHVGPGGVAEVTQARGDALYRVPEGPPVHLRAGKLSLEVYDAVFRIRYVDGEVEAHALLGHLRARSGDERARVPPGFVVRTRDDGLGPMREVGLDGR
ncbi:MAG: hypothetical protein H6721_17210 [Sandaracinus sp.]|nr:hypothetical protein [Sandaracinus sp.]